MDETGKIYIGLTLDWYYDKGYIDVSMPDCLLQKTVRTENNSTKIKITLDSYKLI